MFRHKAGGDLSWSTEPRTEYFVSVGCVDRRLTLPGYVGGVKKRESKQMEARIKTMWYNENPSNQKKRNGSNNETSTEEQELELREQQYVPRTDFDLEN